MFWQNIKDGFSLDLRSLSIMRFLMGVALLYDSLTKISHIPELYGSKGHFPLTAYNQIQPLLSKFNLFTLFESSLWPNFLFALLIICAIFFTLGFKTKIFQFISFVILAMSHFRNPNLNSGGDEIFRLIFFITLFLPLNRFFSIDSALNLKKVEKINENNNKFTFIFILQLLSIYYFSALLKNHPSWWRDFTALEYALNLPIFRSTLGEYFLNFRVIGKGLTFATFYGEWLLPMFFILLSPFKKIHYYLRNFCILFFIGFHLGIFLMMNIDMFPFICIVFWIGLLPGKFWQFLKVENKFKNIKIYYDGKCLFCRKTLLIILEFLFPFQKIKIYNASIDPIIHQQMIQKNSWVIKELNTNYFHFNAFLILYNKSIYSKLIRLNILKFIGNKIYFYISTNRNKLSKITKFFKINETYHHSKKFLFLSLLYFIFLISYNFKTLTPYKHQQSKVDEIIMILGLSQNWNMFSPLPRNLIEWYQISYTDKEGTEIDYFTKKRFFEYEPKDSFLYIDTKLEKKWHISIIQNPLLGAYYMEYLCNNNPEAKKFNYYYYFYKNLLNNQIDKKNKVLHAFAYCK